MVDRGRRRRRTLVAAGVLLGLVMPAAACASGPSRAADGVVELEFFQFKGEAVGDFQKLVEAFNAQNPGIRVVQNDQPDADTAIRVRLVKEDVPDVMSLNANGAFAELAKADVFHDFAKDPAASKVTAGSRRIIGDLVGADDGRLPGVPFAMNADPIIYNKAIFAKHKIAVPRTWPELTAACEKLKAAGVTPVYGTLKEAWTALPSFNALTAPVTTGDFWDRRAARATSFQQAFAEPMARQKTLYSYAQKGALSTDYDTGNQAFAQGKAAMLLQGSWAIPVIRGFKPGFEIGTFPYPVAKDPKDTVVTSGVDVVLTMGKDSPHAAESRKFIEFLMRPENAATYLKAQSAVPTVEGMDPSEPALAPLAPYYRDDRIVGFTDHQVPASVGLEPYLQQALIDGNTQGFLATLDREWDKVAARRSPRQQ